MNKQCVVLCMHRSGSSVIAGILHHIGVDMGRGHYMPATDGNPKGYWEDERFSMLNQKILMLAGGSWNVKLTDEQILAVKPRVDKEIEELVGSRQGLWGWKDPRTAMTYPLFEPYLTNPHFIVVIRGANAIAKSLQARDGIPLDEGHRFAIDYQMRIQNLIGDNTPVTYVSFEGAVEHTCWTADGLRRSIGLPAVPMGFIDKELVHWGY